MEKNEKNFTWIFGKFGGDGQSFKIRYHILYLTRLLDILYFYFIFFNHKTCSYSNFS